MTKFLNGPAKGQVLMLRRAPIFLRVVEEGGKWDALDQPEDEPRPGEKIYAYRRKGEYHHALVDGPKIRGCFVIAEYEVIDPQPSAQVLDNTPKWQSWAQLQLDCEP